MPVLARGDIIRHQTSGREYIVHRVKQRDDHEDDVILLSPLGCKLRPMSPAKVMEHYRPTGQKWAFPQCEVCKGTLPRVCEGSRVCLKCEYKMGN